VMTLIWRRPCSREQNSVPNRARISFTGRGQLISFQDCSRPRDLSIPDEPRLAFGFPYKTYWSQLVLPPDESSTPWGLEPPSELYPLVMSR
jgi:hypothetical protein